MDMDRYRYRHVNIPASPLSAGLSCLIKSYLVHYIVYIWIEQRYKQERHYIILKLFRRA